MPEPSFDSFRQVRRGASAALALLLSGCDAGEWPLAGAFHGRSEVVASGGTFHCTPERLWDGDGPIWCAEGPRVRLAGIAAAEIDSTCRTGRPCPTTDPIRARNFLGRILSYPDGPRPVLLRSGQLGISGPRLSCVSLGRDDGQQTASRCVSPVVGDLSCAMLASQLVAASNPRQEGRDCSPP